MTEVLDPPDCRAAGRCIDDEWHDALDYEPAYEWVADRVGFWPLFLAVGETHDALLTTTYQAQFRRNAFRLAHGRTRCAPGRIRRAS